MKRIFGGVLTVVLVLAFSINIYAGSKADTERDTRRVYLEDGGYVDTWGCDTDEEVFEHLRGAITDANILRWIGYDPVLKSSTMPYEYSSLYIDNEARSIVIQVKMSVTVSPLFFDDILSMETKLYSGKKIELYEDDYFSISFEAVKYTEKEIYYVLNFITDNSQHLSEEFNIVSCGDDIMNNRVRVGILEPNDIEETKKGVIEFLENNLGLPENNYYNDLIDVFHTTLAWTLELKATPENIEKME